MKKIKITTKKYKETILIGKKLALSIKSPATIKMFGHLGVGKTTFCQGFISALSKKKILK